MNLRFQKGTSYLLTFLLLIGVAVFVYFFVPAIRRLESEKLSVAQLHEKLAVQRQSIEGFQPPTEEEKRSWDDSKQMLKAICQFTPDTLLLNEELTRYAMDCGISNIRITPQSRGDRSASGRFAPTDGLPSGVKESISLLKISFHADYESFGRFLQWFDGHSHQASILSLRVKRGVPLVSAEMEVEVNKLSCDF